MPAPEASPRLLGRSDMAPPAFVFLAIGLSALAEVFP
jgi:hypothetical protein